jgi:uncharacterized protein YecE (DUF72 family)
VIAKHNRVRVSSQHRPSSSPPVPSRIRVGVGGWVFPPWRANFYPKGLPQKQELEFASRRLTSIEVNGTYYGSQSPATFAKWRDTVPDSFVFALKGPRFATNRRILAEAGDSIERFFASGVMELKEKLGPINWQFTPGKEVDPADFEKFLKLLPKTVAGRSIRHAVEIRHDSFCSAEFVALARDHGVAIVLAGDAKFPLITDVTAPFVYARIMGTQAAKKVGYAPAALDRWAERAQDWARGAAPTDLPLIAAHPPTKTPRDVFLYVISGAKERNPAAAMALIARLSARRPTM